MGDLVLIQLQDFFGQEMLAKMLGKRSILLEVEKIMVGIPMKGPIFLTPEPI
jgi:hypothetical protein